MNYNINIKGVCLIEGQKIDRCLLNISNVPLSIFNNFDIINDYFQTSGVVNGTFATEFDSKIGLKNGKIYINLGDDVEIKPKFFSENIMVKSINIEANVQNNFELIENIKINFKDDFGLNIDMIGNNIKFYNNQIVDGKLKLSVNELDANKFLVMLKEEYKDKLIFKNFTLKNGLISILTDVNFLNDNNKKQNISIIHNQYKYNILLKLRDAMFVNQKYNIEINNTDIDFVLEKNIVKLNLLNADIFNNHIANLNIINNTLLKKLTINFDNLLLNTKFIKNINHFIFNEKQQEILNKYFYNLYINGEISISNKADNLHCIASNLTLIGNKDLKKNNYIYNVNINKDSKQKNGFINLNIFSEDKKLFNQQKFSFNINNESFDNKNHIIFSIAPETLDTIFGGKIIFQSDLEYLNSTLNINFNNNKIYFQNLNNITNVDIKINKIKLEKWMLKMLNFLTENNSEKELTNFNINIKSFELLDDNFMNNIKCNGMLFNHLEFHGECLFDLYDKKINKITSNLISNKNGEIKVHIDDMSSIINLLYNTKYNVFNIKSDGNFNNNEHLSNLNLVINSTYHNELDAIKQNPIIRAKAKLTIKNGNQVKIENGLIEKKLYKYTVKGVLDFDNNVNHDSNTDLYLKNNKKQNDKNFLTGKIKINTPISTIQDYFASDYDYNSIFNSGNSDYYAGGKNITDMMKNLNIKSKGMLSILEFIFGKVRV